MPAVGAAIAAGLAYIGAGSAIWGAIQVAVAAYSIYSTFSAYSASKKQQKAQQRASMAAQERSAWRNFLNPLAPRRIIYGTTRIAGPFIFMTNPEKRKRVAWMIVAIAAHEIDGFEGFWLLKDRLPVNDERGEWGEVVPGSEEAGQELWSSYDGFGQVTGKYGKNVILWPFRGTADQDVGELMRNAYRPVRDFDTIMDLSLVEYSGFVREHIGIQAFDEGDKLRGIACLVVRTDDFSKAFPQASPDFAATVRGKRVFDPRDGVTRYSANVALCVADYLIHYAEFPPDSINLDALKRAADVCDELVPLKGGGYERRYEAHGVVIADQSHESVIEMFADAMCGKIRYASGQWVIDAGAPKPVSTEIDEAMVLEDYELSIERPTRSLPNAVRGTFWDGVSWQASSFPAYRDEAAIAADGGVVSWMDIELPMTKSHHAAQRIARAMLRRARSRISLSIALDLRGMTIQAGDVVTYSAPDLGIESQAFEVEGWRLGLSQQSKALTTNLDLSQYDPDVFTWDAEADTQEMVRGKADSNSGESGYLEEVTYTETITDTVTNFEASYTVAWEAPPAEDAEVSSVTVKIQAIIYFDDGTKVSKTVIDTATGGDTSKTLSLSRSLGGKIYASHELNVTAKAKLAGGSTGPEQEAVPAE